VPEVLTKKVLIYKRDIETAFRGFVDSSSDKFYSIGFIFWTGKTVPPIIEAYIA